jgi:lipoyl(octanoyl) transferase
MAKDRVYQIEGIVFRRKGEKPKDIDFLLLKRIPEGGGFWQPVTGGVHVKEKRMDALKRELKEEVNINTKNIEKIINIRHSFSFINRDGNKLDEYVFGVEIDPKKEIAISREHTEAKWVNLKKALKMLKYKNNKDGFKKLYKIILNSRM